MNEWSWLLNTIAGILAALSIRSLIIQLGSAVGLGDKLAKVLSFAGVAAGIKKLIGWLGAVIGLLKEGNSFAAVMAVAFPKTAAVVTKVGSAIAGAAKAVGAFIGGLSGGALAAIIAAVAALASSVYFLRENWDAVVQKVNEFCESNLGPIIEEFKGSFEALWGAIQELGASFVNLGASIYGALPDWLQEWLYNVGVGIRDVVAAVGEWFASIDWLNLIGVAIEGLGAIVTGIIGGVIMGAIQAVLNLVESAVQIVTGVVQIISGIVSAFVNLIVGLFTGDFSKALDSVELIWEGIKNVFKGACDAVIGTVWGFIEGIIDFFTHMWDVLVGHSIVPDTIEAIIEWFAYLPVKVFETLAGFVKGVIDFVADLAKQIGSWAVTIWDNIKAPFVVVGTWFSDIFSGAWEGIKKSWRGTKTFFKDVLAGIKDVFKTIPNWFKDTFKKAWENVKSVFSKGGKVFDGIKDGILDGLKAVINTLIGGINKVIAIPFNGLNDALETLKDLSILGVEPFGWIDTIPVPEIPKLARGGIVDHATLAMIGERGKEAVVPLENNTGWIDKLVDKLTARNDRPEKIVLMLDGKELGWANINSINDITRQTGALQLVMA
jgi:phage-related protein